MNQVLKISITISMIMLIYTCNTPELQILTECADIKYTDENLMQFADKLYSAPCFNPQNPNEFIYVEYEPNEMVYNKKLWKFNLLTNEKTFIADHVWHYPKYGLHEWIFFNRFNTQIWKVKSNGDSLQPLFTEEQNYDLEACLFDERIIFRRVIESDYFVMFSDYYGNIQNEIIGKVYSDGSWSLDGNKILSLYSDNSGNLDMGIALYDTLFNLNNVLLGFPYQSNDDAIHGMDWCPDSENFIWCKRSGVYRVNINSGLQEQLLEGCSASDFGWPSIAIDNSKILFENTTLKHIEGNAYYKESNIVITDIDGMVKTLINLE